MGNLNENIMKKRSWDEHIYTYIWSKYIKGPYQLGENLNLKFRS